jgi:hypothetical protein
MTNQAKWALGVLGFVVTATVARRVGQYEVMDLVEKRISLAQPPPVPTATNMFSSLTDQPLRDCILDGDRSACRVVATKLGRP